MRLMPQVVAALDAAPPVGQPAAHRRAGAARAPCWPPAARHGARLGALPLLWSALTSARDAHAWLDVLAIVRAWDVPLVVACQWDAAKRMLDWHAKAAWKLGDELERAWALHQRGTLELAQGLSAAGGPAAARIVCTGRACGRPCARRVGALSPRLVDARGTARRLGQYFGAGAAGAERPLDPAGRPVVTGAHLARSTAHPGPIAGVPNW